MPSRSAARREADAHRQSIAPRLRALRRLLAIAARLGLQLLLHGAWRALGARSPWPRRFLAGVARAGGIDVAVTGTPLARDVLFVANHLTWFDIPVLAGATGGRFVAKADIARWGLIGTLADMNRTVYVARAERARVAEQGERLRAALAEGQPVVLFPEGGTGDGRALKPFQAGLLAALIAAPGAVRLQPVAIDYGRDRTQVAWAGETPFGAELMRLLGLPGRRRATLRFLAPIDPGAARDRKALAAAARAAIAAALGEPHRPTL